MGKRGVTGIRWRTVLFSNGRQDYFSRGQVLKAYEMAEECDGAARGHSAICVVRATVESG